jgi:hypothetical protein
MREIKFRAWDKDSKMFVAPNAPLEQKIPTVKTRYGFRLKSKFILQQFTGAKEHCHENPSDNREIYDGDIVEFSDGKILSVEWNDDTCQWQFSDGSPINNGDRYGTYKKIVGNIYEHPHLLTPHS